MVWQMRVFSLEPGPWSLGLILQKSRIENVRQNPEPGKHERKIQKESAVWCLRQTNGPRAGPACQLASRARQSSGPELTTASSEKLRVDRVAIKALQSQESSQNARIRSRIKKAESTERRSHMPCMETTWRHKSQTLFSIKRIIPWTFFDKIKNNLTVEILTTVWNWHLLRVTTSKHKRACQKLALRLGSEPLWTYVKIYATWRQVSQTKQLIAAASQSFAGIHGLRGSKDESSYPRIISSERAKMTSLCWKISSIQVGRSPVFRRTSTSTSKISASTTSTFQTSMIRQNERPADSRSASNVLGSAKSPTNWRCSSQTSALFRTLRASEFVCADAFCTSLLCSARYRYHENLQLKVSIVRVLTPVSVSVSAKYGRGTEWNKIFAAGESVVPILARTVPGQSFTAFVYA